MQFDKKTKEKASFFSQLCDDIQDYLETNKRAYCVYYRHMSTDEHDFEASFNTYEEAVDYILLQVVDDDEFYYVVKEG